MQASGRVLRRACAAAAAAALSAGCAAEVPEGKPWTIDTGPWAGSEQCDERPCALDAYATRDFSPQAALPDTLSDGDVVTVHCWVPTPAVQRDPIGRDAYSWYLLTVDDSLVWAPDLALTSAANLRLDPTLEGEHLSAGVVLCHSAVPGR